MMNFETAGRLSDRPPCQNKHSPLLECPHQRSKEVTLVSSSGAGRIGAATIYPGIRASLCGFRLVVGLVRPPRPCLYGPVAVRFRSGRTLTAAVLHPYQVHHPSEVQTTPS